LVWLISRRPNHQAPANIALHPTAASSSVGGRG
jgi:hypothetical protein